MIKLKHLLETTLRTNHGSVIRRFKDNVGKKVGTSLYVHKLYADEVIPKNILQRAEDILTRSNPDFAYNSIMFDPQRGIIRFDEAPDFDTASEPTVGNYITVFLNRSNTSPPQKGHSDSIWHHKWLWVKDDYTGFDVDKSKEWSRQWLAKLNEPAKGSKLHWQSQLKNVGLVNESILNDKVGLGQFGPNDEIQFILIPTIESRTAEHSSRFVHRSNRRFRVYPTGKNTAWIYWGANPPSQDEIQRVDDFLHKKGITVTVQRDFHLNNLTEGLGNLPPVVLGAINPSHEVMSVNGVDDFSRHPMNWGAYLKWRYVPEIQYLYWWEAPSDEEKMMVIDYLERKGYKVRKSATLTMRENDDDDDDDGKVDINRLMWNDSYLDDVAEQLGYKDNFNDLFWKFPQYLYHCTPEENRESIEKNGIGMMDKTRGFSSNRHIGAAVFTTSEEEEIPALQDSYGPVVFSINTPQMKKDGYMPTVEKEPDWARAEKISFVLQKFGHPEEKTETSRFVDSSEGTTPYTVIMRGQIPSQYLSIYD